ncbi:MAG: hypothetical protein JW927_00080 [Deltaproteobacteria bacterium]|nr:hypothetical protein [Deltaproteobacteria bacterium]
MFKIKIIIAMCFLFVFLFQFPSYASDLELVITDVKRISEKEVVIKYGVISRKNFDFPNVSIAFKILVNDKPIGCKEVRAVIPEGSDGSDIQETTISTSSGDEAFTLSSRIFYSTKRYRIEEWFSDCESFK